MTKKLAKLDARIPTWDFSDLLERDCPICMSKDHEEKFVRPDDLIVRHCATCNTYFISPSPSEAQLNSFYSKYDVVHRREPKVSGRAMAAGLRRADPMADFRIQEIVSMMDLKGKACLDIGFGRGLFLYYFKSLGARAFGVEVDPHAILCAKEYFGIQSVIEGTIFDLSGDSKFDVIIMNNFIEHPLEPAKLFEKAVSLLAPHGLLVIHTANASFIDEEEQPIAFRVDLEHMQYFSFATCLFLAREHCLDIVHIESVGFPGLKEIDRLLSERARTANLWVIVKNALKLLPGFKFADSVRRSFSKRFSRERTGRFCLFCIFRKPS